MKIRLGFVSNSSSSSFIIIGDPSGIPKGITYERIPKRLAKEIIEEIRKEREYWRKKGYSEGEEEVEWNGEPVYITQFISDVIDEHSNVYELPNSYAYEGGGHGGPYEEEDYTPIKGNDEYDSVYIPNRLAHLLDKNLKKGQLEFDFEYDEND